MDLVIIYHLEQSLLDLSFIFQHVYSILHLTKLRMIKSKLNFIRVSKGQVSVGQFLDSLSLIDLNKFLNQAKIVVSQELLLILLNYLIELVIIFVSEVACKISVNLEIAFKLMFQH